MKDETEPPVSAEYYMGWTACKEQASRAIDEYLNRRWPDAGDRPSSPPAAVIHVADIIMALKEPKHD